MSEKTPYQIMREKQKDVIEKQRQAALQMAAVWKANHERNKRLENLRVKEQNSRQSYAQSALDDDVPFTPIVIDDTSNKCSSDYSTPSTHSVSHSSSHSSCDSGSSSGSESSSCSSSGGCD